MVGKRLCVMFTINSLDGCVRPKHGDTFWQGVRGKFLDMPPCLDKKGLSQETHTATSRRFHVYAED